LSGRREKIEDPKEKAARRFHFGQFYLNSLLSSGTKLLYGSTSPWLMLVFIVLMAVSCSRFYQGETSGVPAGNFQHTESVPKPAHRVKYEIFDIPGLGRKYEDCGKIFKIWLCEKCGYKQPIKNTCDRPDCSECWTSWASKEVKRVVERINGFKEAYKKVKGRRLGNPQDVILSPPQKEAKKEVLESGGVEKLRKKAVLMIKAAGIRGGLLIFHPYRIRSEFKAALFEVSKKEDKKFWALVHEDALGLGDWRLYVYLAPHFHIIGFGNRVNGAEVYDKTGWICKFKGHLSKDKDVSRAVYYFLTHTAIREGKRAETWFGSLSYNQLSKSKRTVEYDVKRCPECGADLIIEYVLTGRREEGFEKIVTWTYKMKSKPPPKQIKLPWVNEK